MPRTHSTEYTRIKRDRKNRFGRCELCGDTRGLELHHIIPVVLGGNDSEENLLLVCKVCHTKLSPKSELIKLGMSHIKAEKFVSYSSLCREIYSELEETEQNQDYYGIGIDEVLDIVQNSSKSIYEIMRGAMYGRS